MKKIDFSAINEESESIFFDTVTENLSTYNFSTASNSELTEKLVNTVKNCAETTLPKKNRIEKNKPWNNDEKLKKLFQSKDELMSKNGDQKLISAVRKKIRHRVRFLRNEHYKQEAEKINQLYINREIEKLFSRAKSQQSTLNPINSTCPPEKILKHFKNHFNPDDPSETRTPDEFTEENLPEFVDELRSISENNPITDLPPSIEEIQKHLKALKANKASNDIEPELLNRLNNHPIMIQVVHRLMMNLWDNFDLPNSGEFSLKNSMERQGIQKRSSQIQGYQHRIDCL